MNVIVILADSLRFDYLGCYGNKWIKTPNIDKFAGESVVFENAYAEGLPTIPVRKALFTGRYTLPFSGWEPLLPNDIVLSEILFWEGIRSALITDTLPMHMPRFGYGRGFDFVKFIRGGEFDPFYRKIPLTIDLEKYHKPQYDDKHRRKRRETPNSLLARGALNYRLRQTQCWQSDEDQCVAQVCKASMEYLEKIPKNKEFFLWLDSFDPHEPWDPPSVYDPAIKCPYDLEYEGKDIISPVSTYVDDYLTEEENHHIRMLYAEKITIVDKWIGKFLEKLKELELYDDSLIIFLSDHGEPLGNREHGHGIITKCRPWPYEELAHIPLIIRHPEGYHQRTSTFVETVDIAPTILNFFKIQKKKQIHGKNLIPLLLGEAEKIKDFAISGYFNFSWSIQTETRSYIHWIEKKEVEPEKLISMYGFKMWENTDIWTCTPGSIPEVPKSDELYNRKTDPFQLNNTIENDPDIAKEMFKLLRDYMFELKSN
jgi:arylsulfatase A-like enzyme